METLALARDAERAQDRRLQARLRRVLPLRGRDGRQEGRQDLQRSLRRTLRGRRTQATALRALLRARHRRQALSVCRRAPLQPIKVCPNILLLLRVSAVYYSHRDAPPKDEGTHISAGLRGLVDGLCESARWVRMPNNVEKKPGA